MSTVVDQVGNAITSTRTGSGKAEDGGKQALDVAVISGGGGGGDASAANQTSQITLATTLNSLTTTIDAVLDAILAGQLPDSHNVTVDNASIAITAAALPLPTGAATSASQLPDGHNVTVDNASLTIDPQGADGATETLSSITAVASSHGGTDADQVGISVTPVGTGRFYFSVGGTATTSNAWLTRSSPLVISNYTGAVSLIRSAGSGTVQVNVLTRS